MNGSAKIPRIDEILLKAKLVTPEQIQKALARQKINGGRIGFHLIDLGFIDEAGMVKALAIQFNCEGLVVSTLKISKDVLEMIPSEVAHSRKVLPFAFDSKTNTLKIACDSPTNSDLIQELKFLAQEKKIKLYIAAEFGLNKAIKGHYGEAPGLSDREAAAKDFPQNELLLVTDERYSGPVLKSLFEWDGFKVTVTDSADDAIELIGSHSFHTVFIKDSVPGDYIDLIDRLRKISPRTIVRYFETTSSLLLNEGDLVQDSQLYFTNLDLFTSILASQNKQLVNQSGRMGRYVTKLCDKLGLPHKERLLVATAAYVHDLAKFYYSDPNVNDVRTQVAQTAKLLQSINYSPVVIQMLLRMYKDLEGKYTKRLPIEALGGNILTVVDLFCASIKPEQKLSMDKFDVVKRKLHELTGRLFLAEIVGAFITMIQEEILNSAAMGALGQIMILGDKVENMQPVELRLKNEGFRVVCETSQESLADMLERSEPDVLLVISTLDPGAITKLIDKIVNPKSGKAKIPVFLLVREHYVGQLTAMLDKSVEDIISLDNNLDILVSKLRSIVAVLNEKPAKREIDEEKYGATGRLRNMSLLDLLQATGPGRKTVKITVISQDKSQKLEMFLDKGKIIYAKLGDIKGAEAVYEAMAWTDGIWSMEPVDPEAIPKPNNSLSNELILMEGCRLLDEKNRSGQVMIK